MCRYVQARDVFTRALYEEELRFIQFLCGGMCMYVCLDGSPVYCVAVQSRRDFGGEYVLLSFNPSLVEVKMR